MFQLKIIRQLITAGFIDQVAVRKDHVEKASSTGVQRATSRGVPYKALGISEDVFIHPSSVLANTAPPDYIVFNEAVGSTRIWLKGTGISVHSALYETHWPDRLNYC
jgi:ATP-dependent RNA helicase DHX37/DHR1